MRTIRVPQGEYLMLVIWPVMDDKRLVKGPSGENMMEKNMMVIKAGTAQGRR